MSATIHSTAVVDPAAKLGSGVHVGPHAVIGPRAEVGDGCRIGPHCVLDQVKLGKNNVLTAHVFAGTPPQDLRHAGEDFFVVAGDGNTFRECVTLNRGTKGDTVIGSNCFLMAYSHVAHDCKVGSGVIMANSATLAGHVEVGDGAVLSGLMAAHQFTRIGPLAMVSGLTGVVMDIPPFCTATGARAELAGLNLVGLRRSGLSRDAIAQVKAAYRTLFLEGLRLEEAIGRLKASQPAPAVQQLIAFCETSKRGIARPRFKALGEEREEAPA